jgi:DNA gyrase/topoisomerase IV subunit B
MALANLERRRKSKCEALSTATTTIIITGITTPLRQSKSVQSAMQPVLLVSLTAASNAVKYGAISSRYRWWSNNVRRVRVQTSKRGTHFSVTLGRGGDRKREKFKILTEEDSAASFSLRGLDTIGRELYGVFPLRGKIVNPRLAIHNGKRRRLDFCENEEVKNLTCAFHGQVVNSVP